MSADSPSPAVMPSDRKRRGRSVINNNALSPPDDLIAALRRRRPVVLVDDADRENEGDLVLPAECATEEWIAFTIRYTGGVLCLAMTPDRADLLELPPMVAENRSRRGTNYTISIEAAEGIETGISARDRALTIRTTVRNGVTARDLVRPGHVFPLRAHPDGLRARAGHTEAAVELARRAGFQPVAMVSELMNDDGTMMRLPELLRFGAKHDLRIGVVRDLRTLVCGS